ncbi:MAG TPA: NADH-quinone oxidoreductase subunit C [Candidatus Marinimicrobia bacterium]|nr:NADH-quinone oxidoreductase subunit C [Candidatus Neomarinimicrobiota bacterium]HRS52878.1 NADH-quinone oxidoreductase subunit C [Candidatus Neomarinimicrobiota bacterium]HRU92024.1 NADH-quinone oxidoreductase subunit C [Candidatus Neomarinimicrobiota bacterium]
MDDYTQFLELMRDKITQVIEKPRRLYFVVSNENLKEIARYLFVTLGCRLSTASAQETYHGLEILYHFSHDASGCYYCPRVVLNDKKNPKVNTITDIVTGALWIEREIFDLWGIEFVGHPRMDQLLTLNSPENPDRPLRFGRLL